MEQEKILKLSQEIENIKREQSHIKALLTTNNLSQLDVFLENELTKKYMTEKFVYNIVNPLMPVTIQENANNAFNFLESLKREKEIELAKKTFKSQNIQD